MKLEDLEIELNNLKDYKCLSFQGWTVIDPVKFIDSSIAILKANPKKRRFLPYYQRLLQFLEANK